MEREPENEERTPEVDSQNRRSSGDELDTTPDQMGASGAGRNKSGGRNKEGESQGDGSGDSNSGG
jgi:hypothetical protein